MRTPVERFWDSADTFSTPELCWVWQGVCHRGYGQFWVGGRNVRAHRFAYGAFVGPIPDDLEIDHLCRNRSCVNPAHLEPVAQAENRRRADAARTRCPAGHLYDGVNLRGNRICLICRASASRRYATRQRGGPARAYRKEHP